MDLHSPLGPFFDKWWAAREQKRRTWRILERERVGGGEVVVVGDDQRGFNTALPRRCWFVGVVTPSSQFTSWPVYNVDNRQELESIVDRFNRGSQMPHDLSRSAS